MSVPDRTLPRGPWLAGPSAQTSRATVSIKKLSLTCGFLLAVFGASVAAAADDPATQGSQPAAKLEGAAGNHDSQAILTDLRATKEKLDDAMPSLSAIADPEFRKQEGATLRPILQHTTDLLEKLAAAQTDDTERQGLADDRCQYLAMLAALGDGGAGETLEKLAANSDAKTLAAKSALLLSRWWWNSQDAGAQQKLLADYMAVAKANPASERVTLTLAIMASMGPASDELSHEAAAVLRKVMIGERAKKLAAELDPAGAQRELLDHPLVVAGRTSTGKSLTTADWKDKVVLVDCWATWCGPCNAEIPRMKELYATYHAKGLEIVGIDCDSDDDTVNAFVKEKSMPWPQLREESQSEKEPWHPLAARWGVSGIPTMFLIDKKGVLRFIDARDDTATKIDTLLAE
jgi:thiol-disulfide isomerase/thioredoxin